MNLLNSILNTINNNQLKLGYPKRTNRLVLLIFSFVLTVSVLLWSYPELSSFDYNDFLPSPIKIKPIKPYDNVLNYLKKNESIHEKFDIFDQEVKLSESRISAESTTNLELLDFDRKHIKYIYPEVIQSLYEHTDKDSVDWSKFAYVLYATSSAHMCNSMMIFSELRKFGTRAELVLIVKKEFITEPENFKYEYDTLTQFAIQYNVKLKPTEVIQIGGDSVNIWLSSYTKLMVFDETDYDRIIYMDSDALLIRDNLDELFFIPPCKMAVSTAYWHTRGKFSHMKPHDIVAEYNPERYGFRPLTVQQRLVKIGKLLKKSVYKYLSRPNFYSPTIAPSLPNIIPNWDELSPSELDSLKLNVNKKNFYTNVYNKLPNYPTLKEFDLTNIVMVIEPTAELFEKVLKAIKEKKKDEFDMELVQYHLFEFFDILKRQEQLSKENSPFVPFEKRLTESPEFLILPHQVYGTLTQEVNIEQFHNSYMTDAHEQIFAHLEWPTDTKERAYYDLNNMENSGDYLFKQVKYLHFSDAPIPKPWFAQKPMSNYMAYRIRCPSHPDFERDDIRSPRTRIDDCSAAKHWEEAHRVFKATRLEVCGLELIDTDKDTYNKIIN